MSWFNIDDVRGDHLIHHMDEVVVSSEAFNMKAMDAFVASNKRPLKFIHAEGLNGKPVFKVSYMDGGNAILDPQTAQSLSPKKNYDPIYGDKALCRQRQD